MNISKDIIIGADISAVYSALQAGSLFKATRILEKNFKIDFQKGGSYFLEWPEAGQCRGVFENIVPNKRIQFSWIKTEAKYSDEVLETEVEIELEELPSGTRLRLKHTGFNLQEAYESHNSGWDSVLVEFSQNLQSRP